MKTAVRDTFTDSSMGCIGIVDHSANTTLELYLSKTIFDNKNTEKQCCVTVGPLGWMDHIPQIVFFIC